MPDSIAASVPPAASMRFSSARAPASMSFVRASISYEPADGIDGVGHTGLERDDLLRAQRKGGRFFGGQRQRLVAAVAVQRLRAAQHRGQRLDGDADQVVVRLLGGQRAAGCLRMEAQLLRARIGDAEPLVHQPRPQPAGGAELRDLFEKIVVRREEERHALARCASASSRGAGGPLRCTPARWPA